MFFIFACAMAASEEVLRTARWVMAQATHVLIDEDALEREVAAEAERQYCRARVPRDWSQAHFCDMTQPDLVAQ